MVTVVRKICLLALISIAVLVSACSSRKGAANIQENDVYTPKPVASSPYKVRVVQVCNDTHQVYDVDIIGLLWNGIEDSLKKRGMLWDGKTQDDPYIMECHILRFKDTDMAERFVPYVGDTVLVVKVELSQGGKHLATIESQRKIALGRGTFTRKAWKKIFEQVSEDVVNQAAQKF
jgi:hypothetical protein